MSYRIELPVFSGPMDLLLHLVRQQEVDIHEIRIAKILKQYLKHLGVLEALNLDDLGEFVVMASTLMEIKSKELLPREEVDLEEELSPRDDLIRRLLEYKRYRDISRRLADMMQRRSRMLDAVLPLPDQLRESDAEGEMLDLGEVEIWDLTEVFSRLLEEIAGDEPLHFGISGRTVTYYVEKILERTRGREEVVLEQLFDQSEGRYGLIGVFTAMLELMKQGHLRAWQEENRGQVKLVLLAPPHWTAADILRVGEEGEEEELGDEEPEPELEPTQTPIHEAPEG